VSKTVGVLIGHEHLRFVDEGVLRFFITYEDHCIGLVYLFRVNGVQPRNCIVDWAPYASDFISFRFRPKLVGFLTKQVLIIVDQRHIALFLRVKEAELTSVCHFDCVLTRAVFMFMASIVFKHLIRIFNPFEWFFGNRLRSGLRMSKHVKLIILFRLERLIHILFLLILAFLELHGFFWTDWQF
jgi:hypothetical protein